MKTTICYAILLPLIVIIGCKDQSQTLPTSASRTTSEKANKTIISNKKTTNHQDDWYWKNTTMSKNNTFENWKHGPAEVVMEYRLRHNKTVPKTLKVGSIDSDGTITINLPENIPTETNLANLSNLVFYDLQELATLNYENPDAGYFAKTTLSVVKNGDIIGTITLGNSVRVTYNLTNQSTLTMGDEGYIISWTYLDEAASMKGTENTINQVRRDGTKSIEAENTVVYELEFKPGWNLVQTEVIGKYDLEHERGLNASWFKKHLHKVVLEIPEDAAYYFRLK
ncbi:MAG: hypothetical protein R3243_08955 [Arenibacter latericius]|nr:hypothetical protein [Arenibacter latericius]